MAIQFSWWNTIVKSNSKVSFIVVLVSLLIIISYWQFIKPQNVESFLIEVLLYQEVLCFLQTQGDKLKFPLKLSA